MKKKNFELVVLIFLLVAATVFMVDAFTAKIPALYKSGVILPYSVPKVVIGLLMILCLGLLIKNIILRIQEKKAAHSSAAAAEPETKENSVTDLERKDKIKVIITMVLIILYVLTWNLLGFMLATLVFVFVELLILPEKPSIIKAFITAAGTTAVCYLLFVEVFSIRFPTLL